MIFAAFVFALGIVFVVVAITNHAYESRPRPNDPWASFTLHDGAWMTHEQWENLCRDQTGSTRKAQW